MESTTIRRPVTLKVVVTPELKKETLEGLKEAIREIEKEIAAIDGEAKRLIPDLERKNLKQAMELKRQIEVERTKRTDLKVSMEARIQEAQAWELDEEVVQGRLEGIAEVKVGDNLNEILSTSIVVKDNKVIKITSEG